jgi:hypothetical protein
MVEGPEGTLIAGYANGLVGIWSLANGARLEHDRLHGPVTNLLRRGSRLYAATELGEHLVLDLSVFDTSYCELMRRVWEAVPVVWERGVLVLRPPPDGHRCRRAGR